MVWGARPALWNHGKTVTVIRSKRTPDQCQHRHRLEGLTQKEQPVHVCKLLKAIVGAADDDLLIVQDEMCCACCDCFQPTMADWNPVVASLVHMVADSIITAHGVDGCSVTEAERLKDAAIQSIPVVLPEEDDSADDIQHIRVPKQLSLQELQQILPPPGPTEPAPAAQTEWAIGVTTAPRRQSTLSTCLTSLIASGWDRPHLFVDGQVSIETSFQNLPITRRPRPVGAWPAWVETLRSLLVEYPAADKIAIFQDDALFPGVHVIREYVESVLWSDPKPGILSLYTASDDMQEGNLWRPLPGIWKLGAVAMVFSRQIAAQLLHDADAGQLNFVVGTAGIDTRIGQWADRQKLGIWHPSPSLVQHIGQVSSVWQTSRAVGVRRADRFMSNELPEQLTHGNPTESR